MTEAPPQLDASIRPTEIIGMIGMFKLALRQGDLERTVEILRDQAARRPDDAGIPLDLAFLHFVRRRPAEMEAAQRSALSRERLFRVGGEHGSPRAPRLRVLALCMEGDPNHNLPIDFILDGSGIALDLLYLSPGGPFPGKVPDHDVAFASLCASDETDPLLRRLAPWLARWPRPVVNDPRRVAPLSRDGTAGLLEGVPGLRYPRVERRTRAETAAFELELAPGPGPSRSWVVRPVGSHAGRNLERVEGATELAAYLDRTPGDAFFLSPFVDYRDPDGWFRKYRIVFIEGRPHLCHLAISEHWIVHYINAGMDRDAARRAEEAAAMAGFASGFAARHAAAFRDLAERVGLDYFGIDCGETREGELLIFEVETGLAIHDLDPVDLFPYKQVQMRTVFRAFAAFLEGAARRPSGLARP